MPTIFRHKGLRFFFYANEGNEPPHVHVVGRGGDAKIWLCPIGIARTYGLAHKDNKEILKITEKNVKFLLEKWKEWHGPASQKR